MEFDAITLDTQAIETNGFDFDGGLLAQLKQFKNGPTQVVITTLTAVEVSRHLRDKWISTRDSVESAHKKAIQYGLKSKDEVAFAQPVNVRHQPRERLAKYFDEIGAKLLST